MSARTVVTIAAVLQENSEIGRIQSSAIVVTDSRLAQPAG